MSTQDAVTGQLRRFETREIRHAVDERYTVVLTVSRSGLGVIAYQVHVERKNGGNLGVHRDIWTRRDITNLDEARAVANSYFTDLRAGKRP
jgi:hypothetical protein